MKKVLIFVLATAMILSITACGTGFGEISTPESTEPTIGITEATAEPRKLSWPQDAASLDSMLSSEPNSSARVDEIAFLAKDIVEAKIDTLDDEFNAYDYVTNTYPNFYDSNETMEYAMFCGYYLYYKYPETSASSILGELGYDTSRAIKYVYRGAETIEDAAYALEDIGEDIEEFEN